MEGSGVFFLPQLADGPSSACLQRWTHSLHTVQPEDMCGTPASKYDFSHLHLHSSVMTGLVSPLFMQTSSMYWQALHVYASHSFCDFWPSPLALYDLQVVVPSILPVSASSTWLAGAWSAVSISDWGLWGCSPIPSS